jgi:hypothetical protein
VKWWLLALPHYVVVGFFTGGWFAVDTGNSHGDWGAPWGGGLILALVLFGVVVLLFTRRYPGGIFDFVIGMNRWCFRVLAYAALMTDRYPPFRLDQGQTEAPAPTTEHAA